MRAPLMALGSLLLLMGIAKNSLAQSCTPQYLASPFGSIVDPVRALASFDDGNGTNAVYIGGDRSTFNGVSVGPVLRWWTNTNTWDEPGVWLDELGARPRSVYALEILDLGDGPRLHAGTDHGVFRLEDGTWRLVALGPSQTNHALAAIEVTGVRRLVVGSTYPLGVRYFDGATWRPLGAMGPTSGTGFLSNPAAVSPAARLIAFGSGVAGGGAQWDGEMWSPIASNVSCGGLWSGIVGPLESNAPGVVFAGGYQGGTCGGVCYLENGQWVARCQPNVPSYVYSFAAFDGGEGTRIYCAAGGLRKWNGEIWQQITLDRPAVSFGPLLSHRSHPWSSPTLIVGSSSTNSPPRTTGVARITSCLPCRLDLDASGSVSIQDLLSYLQAWFAHSPTADFDDTPGVDLNDLFAYLAAWHVGCL